MIERSLDISHVALKRRRTKIVATLGPASSSDETVEALIVAGVNVFRLNFSHGTHPGHAANLERVRRLSEKLGAHTAVLADLCGPKIRVGHFEGGSVELSPASRVIVTCREVLGNATLIPSQYQALATDVRPGDRILLDDGKLELRVEKIEGPDVCCVVVHGGWLSDKKGMNLPGVAVSADSLTDKDRQDATFASALGVDYMALSFVRRASDVVALREHLGEGGRRIALVSKIEKPEALEEIGPILEVSDAIMVARGDLGVEMAPEVVPIIQQELIRRAVQLRRPVIVATQMLESMIENARPTRAEVTDVAAAAYALADAVMLSAETAAGKHPVAAVATMDRVLRLVEGYQWKRGRHGHVLAHRRAQGALESAEALSRATSLLSGDLDVRAIAVPTRSGRTAALVSAARPNAPIVALTDDPSMCRRLNLLWGVMAELAPQSALLAPAEAALATVRRLELAEPGQPVLLVWDSGPSADQPQPTVSILSA